MRVSLAVALVVLGLAVAARSVSAAGKAEPLARVTTLRVPHGGIQPQIALDSNGVVHMVYFLGAPGNGDLYYARSSKGGTFSTPIRVNSRLGSAIATGNVRGARLAAGRNGRVHVAWNGTYEVDVPGSTQAFMRHPMVYTRLDDSGTAFEPERNVIRSAYGLDGGGAIAADGAGRVYVMWHAPTPGTQGENNRRVWVTRSSNDGVAFERERPAFETPTGACGCCGMSALADGRDNLYILFRSAREVVHRDMYLLASRNHGESFQGTDVSEWNIGACVMSTESMFEGPSGVLAAWETMGNVYYGVVDPSTARVSNLFAAPGETKNRKYPVVVANTRGETLLAWTEGMGWQKGGSLAWQIFDQQGHPTGTAGRADGVPMWSLLAAFPRPDGNFTIVY